MSRPCKPYIPQDVGELLDHLGMMLLSSPSFKDSYFTEQTINTVFLELNAGFGVVRKELGDARYNQLIELSDQMRRHFEADPDDDTGESRKGRKIIHEMEFLLTASKTANDNLEKE